MDSSISWMVAEFDLYKDLSHWIFVAAMTTEERIEKNIKEPSKLCRIFQSQELVFGEWENIFQTHHSQLLLSI